MPEADIPGERDYKQELIYKHSWRGDRDRKIRSLKMRGKKKYARAGCIVGAVAGVLVGAGLLLAWGWL
ncbi:MAG: hypothetical protein GY803_30810 [Chloroflexi bacterium]|nr:hypothetical protein [Chloroflexota bacterium]